MNLLLSVLVVRLESDIIRPELMDCMVSIHTRLFRACWEVTLRSVPMKLLVKDNKLDSHTQKMLFIEDSWGYRLCGPQN